MRQAVFDAVEGEGGVEQRVDRALRQPARTGLLRFLKQTREEQVAPTQPHQTRDLSAIGSQIIALLGMQAADVERQVVGRLQKVQVDHRGDVEPDAPGDARAPRPLLRHRNRLRNEVDAVAFPAPPGKIDAGPPRAATEIKCPARPQLRGQVDHLRRR